MNATMGKHLAAITSGTVAKTNVIGIRKAINHIERLARITKAEFYNRGGFANSALFRLQSRGGAWRYYVNLDRVEG